MTAVPSNGVEIAGGEETVIWRTALVEGSAAALLDTAITGVGAALPFVTRTDRSNLKTSATGPTTIRRHAFIRRQNPSSIFRHSEMTTLSCLA